MKNLFILVLLIISMCLWAQNVPQTIDYQGRLADSDGNYLNGVVTVNFLIFNVETGGTALWTETQDVSTANGIFHVQLGSVAAFPGTLFDNSVRWLELIVGGETLSPRTCIASVPYSIKSETAYTVEAPLNLSENVSDPNSVIKGENTGTGYGVYGKHYITDNYGYLGSDNFGVYGYSHYSGGYFEGDTYGVYGLHPSGNYGYIGSSDYGVYGSSSGNFGFLGSTSYGVYGNSISNWAGYFDGKIYISDMVGIGTISPTAELDVNGDVNISGKIYSSGSNQFGTVQFIESTLPHTGPHESLLMLMNGSNDPASEANIQFAAGSPAHGRATISATHDVSAGLYNGNLNLEVRNGTTSYIKAITMRSSGNVGIGNEDPSEKLSVSGMVESTIGGFKFPDGTTQTTAATGSTTYSIGDFVLGGIVFWVDETGKHGLIAATSDQSTGIQWYNGSYTTTNAVRDGVYAGQYNTERIITNQGTGSYAAQLCANYQGGNYGDWYLPSKYELNLMYLQKATIGGFASDRYWSSTEYNNDDAWIQFFFNGFQNTFSKNFTFYVRAVRAF